MLQYASAQSIIAETSDICRPSRRMLPSAAATEFGLKDKDGRAWDPDVAPYMVEVLDQLASRQYQGVIFVGPARASKSFSLIHGGLNWIATCAPGDTAVFSSAQDKARELSLTEFDPIVQNSPGLKDRMSSRKSDDNVFDKKLRSGVTLRFGWPSVTQLASSTLQYVFMPDYDRPENRDNVGGQGPFYDQGAKRVETYMSRGKAVAESSPGEDWVDTAWVPQYGHEGPPVSGIVSLYNRGTMARFYWACKGCGERMQVIPGPEMFRVPDFKELVELCTTRDLMGLAQEYARISCRHCGTVHEMQDRKALNLGGRWLHEGEKFLPNGTIGGERLGSRVVSYWLGGAAASFQRWDSMLSGYFTAIREYSRTNDESGIRAKVNTDFGAPYVPRSVANRRKAEDLVKKSDLEMWPRGVVPEGVQFLTAAVDVQANRFVVHVFGWGEGLECWLVDRFNLSQSLRLDGDRPALMDPSAYDQDWLTLIDEVLNKPYPLIEASELSMKAVLTLGDSGGKEGVTQRAYEFFRTLRKAGIDGGFRLIKGANSLDAPRVQETYPDSKNEKDRLLGARGDVPVWRLNTTIFKDAIIGNLACDVPGPGYVHIPKWIDRHVFNEYVAETRGADGWKNRGKHRNEAMDLHGYARAACAILGAESIDWRDPPKWARRPTKILTAAVEPRKNKMADLARRLNG